MSLFCSWELAMTIEITTPFVKSSEIKKLYRRKSKCSFSIVDIYFCVRLFTFTDMLVILPSPTYSAGGSSCSANSMSIMTFMKIFLQ